jgi:peptide/nickel transport system permease protein
LVLRRLILAPLLVWMVATLTFAVVQLAPGTYADTIDNPRLTPAARAHLRSLYGLDEAGGRQYLQWLGTLVHGDLGQSFLFKQPVTGVIATALPPTILLAGTALIMDLLLGVILALVSARRPGGWTDRIVTLLSLGVYGVPSFWLAGLAILLFSLKLGWLPASHMASVGADRWSFAAQQLDLLRHLILPASVLGIVGAASTARYLRASLLDVQRSNHILAARARGLSEGRILWVHTLRPALGPLVTLIGLSLPVLVSGSVVIETIFSWPGMGRILWQAAVARDIPMVMGCTLIGAVAVILGSLAADLLYAWADPRVRSR